MNDINYDEKIKTFQLITDNNDYEVAINYLTNFNWDENKASQNYFHDIHNSSQNQSEKIRTQAHYMEEIQENERMIETKENLLKPNSSVNRSSPARQNQQTSSIWQSFVSYIKSWIFCSKLNVYSAKSNDNDRQYDTSSFLNEIPGKIDNYDIFINNIRSKIGILILYEPKNIPFLEGFFDKLKKIDYLCDVLRENYVLFSINTNSIEGRRIVSLFNDLMLNPSFIFLHNSNQRNLNKNSVIKKLEGELSDNLFYDSLIHSLELITIRRINQALYEDENSHAATIRMQQDELKKLEEMEREKRRKEIEDEKKIKSEIEEKFIKEREKEEQRKRIIRSLPVEPDENDRNSTKIVFRCPDLNRRIERRFLKTDTVDILYNFVDSLGKEIFSESEAYELVQTFPFKSYTNKQRTLGEEGLFPNAIIQIREI